MSSRILGVFLSPFSVFPAEEFKRFRRKPELLLLTGVKIVLLKVWRTVLDLLKGGRGGRHLISFFKIGIVGCFSKNKTKTSRWKSILKGKSLTRLLLFSLLGTWFSFTGTKKQRGSTRMTLLM